MTAPALSYEAALDDGTRVRFRPIEATDKDLLVEGFRRLSPESRYRRFFSTIDRLSSAQLRYLTEIDYENHFAWVAIVIGDAPNETAGVAVGRWIRLAEEPESAEAAITVIDDYQNRGIGGILLRLLARSAVERGVKVLRAWVQADNETIVDLLGSLGATFGKIEQGVQEVNVPLPEDPDLIDTSPARLILRGVASGDIVATVDPRTWGRAGLS